uniref:TetR family transcriptional regulator n=1 Tax=Syphacia muris TaxID=451379 RepID=A0A0N5B1N1_9BILA
MTGIRPERVNGHTGTETRSRLLREAAVGNIAQWGKP